MKQMWKSLIGSFHLPTSTLLLHPFTLAFLIILDLRAGRVPTLPNLTNPKSYLFILSHSLIIQLMILRAG